MVSFFSANANHFICETKPSTSDNGIKKTKGMALESRCGSMGPNMKVNGTDKKLTATADSFTQTETTISDSGKTEKLMEQENMCMLTIQSMKELGQRTNTTGEVQKNGLMELASKVIIHKAKNKVLASLSGQTDQYIKAVSEII